MLTALHRRLRSLLLRHRAENELRDEIAFHLAEETDKLVRAGYPEAEARRRARVAFGGIERHKEDYRDGRGDGPAVQLASDIRHGFRILARAPGLTAAALATLTLGIGAVIAIFTVVNAVVLRPLPFAEPDRLVALWEDNPDKGWVKQYIAPANFFDWEDQVSSFAGVAAYSDLFGSRSLSTATGAIHVQSTNVTGRFFELLGVRAQHGVLFDSSDTWAQSARKAVISDALFREQLQGDPSRVGSSITLDGTAWQVIGVLPPAFAFPSAEVDVWVPWGFDRAARQAVWFRRAHLLRAFARLAPGASIESARADLSRVMSRLERDYPATNTHMYGGLGALQPHLVGGTQKPLLFLLGGTAILLLIACANVGTLLLVRAASREREFVVRRALGASPSRVIRQAFVESMVLSSIGTAMGTGFGWLGVKLVSRLMPPSFLPVHDLSPDARVVLFAIVVALLTGALFGVAPARWGARRDPSDVLKEAGRSGTDTIRGRATGRSLAIGEIALALVLAVGAGLLARSFMQLVRVEPGFQASGVATMRVVARGNRYSNDPALVAFNTALLERATALPGVNAAALTSELPLADYGAWSSPVVERGREAQPGAQDVPHRQISPGYFNTMGVPLMAGRLFGAEDTPTSERVAILNQSAARMVFGGEDAIGRYVSNDLVPDSATIWYRVVGVVGDERQTSLGTPPRAEFFAPYTQDPPSRTTVVVRTAGNPNTMLPALRRALSEVDPALAPVALASMPEWSSRSVGRERVLTTLFVAFAAIGAILALIGVYGVIAQLALRRTQEIGIRVALGAQRGEIRWMIVREGMLLAAIGSAIGLALSLAIGGAIRGLLFGVSPNDPVTLAAMPVLLFLVSAVASLLPAIRATKADPATVLRAAGR